VELTAISRPVVKLGGGPRWPGPPERPDDPCETSVMRSTRKPGKAPPPKKKKFFFDELDNFCIDDLLQFASVTMFSD